MNDAHKQLAVALRDLVDASGGYFAAVVDEGNGLWCIAPPTRGGDQAADRFYRFEIAPRARAMRRGARLSVRKLSGGERYIAESFAAIYVVVVWFSDEFAVDVAGDLLRRALPKIEALTLALPPHDGPGADGGARKMRA
jgi:hypothetical protein